MRSAVCTLLALLAGGPLSGCAWISKDELAAREDRDLDGHIAAQFGGDDCDDALAEVHPGAEELCNSLDDDCDGAIDDVVAGEGTTWYADADGDGAGDPSTVVAGCEQPEGAVADALDCDDSDAAIGPDALEICNGVDDDCDGGVDDADDGFESQTWYPDGDGDGVGGDGETLETADCQAPTGYAARGGDCDDADAAVAPGLDEICDGLDNDCDGLTDDDDDGLTDVPVWYLDSDGDGYGTDAVTLSQCDAPASFTDNALDCDDGDLAISPGADEHCDGVDEDCDGVVDDSAVDVSEWYTDGDGDGWGDAAERVTACEAPAGTVAAVGDCDDTDPSVYPYAEEACTEADTNCDGLPGARDDDEDGARGCDGDCDDGDAAIYPDAPERCNGIDDDCDGRVDDDDDDRITTGLERTYADSDGDGYGDEDDPGELACEPDPGRVSSHDDCDDGDDGVHPDAIEVCSTSADDDCDGSTSDCSVTFGDDGLVFVGEAELDRAGAGLAVADLDGDGVEDLAVAAPGRGSDKGSVYVVLHPSVASEDLGDAAEWKGTAAGDEAGAALMSAGDVDGDGLMDLGVGAPGGEDVFVLSGPASAGGGLTGADAVLAGPGEDSAFGAALWFGDLDHDGVTDVAVGAPLNDQPGLLGLDVIDAGQVYVFYGPLSGDRSAGSADATFIDDDESDGNLGRALAGADTDGDGDAELIVSALDNNGFGTLTPRVYLLDASGGDEYDAGSVSRTFSGTSGRLSGAALSASGDVDGDGTTDLIVGDSAAGQAFLLLGPLNTAPTTLSSADAVLSGSADFGLDVALLPDLDGDGVDELAVGGDDAVALWMGGSDLRGALSAGGADLTVDGARSADEAGAAVRAGDVDGDGALDLLVGAPGSDSEIGAAWGLLGPF